MREGPQGRAWRGDGECHAPGVLLKGTEREGTRGEERGRERGEKNEEKSEGKGEGKREGMREGR